MRIEQRGTEDLLRSTLREKADEAHDGLTFADIRDGAAAQRRRLRQRRLGYLAAAAVVVVAVPAGVYTLTDRDTAGPRPPTSTTSDGPAPSHTPSSTPSSQGFTAFSRGADAKVSYVLGRVVHLPDGSRSTLPAAADDVVSFAPYHGGWIVLDSVGGLAEYDSTGAPVLRSSQGESNVAVSSDGMRTAFQVDGQTRVGITSGMGEGEVTHPLSAGRLVGFLGDRLLVTTAAGLRTIDDAGNETAVPGPAIYVPTINGDLLGGLAGNGEGNQGAVVDTSTGSVLWRSDWRPLRFSPDGRYVAAAPAADEDHPTAIAILDARTGDVVARTGESVGVTLGWSVAWDQDRAVFEAVAGGTQHALLALDVAGRLTRVSDVVTRAPDEQGFVFPALP